MHTVKTIQVGKRAVVVRSSGQVYLAEGEDTGMDARPKLAATSAAGCAALGKAFTEAADWLRANPEQLTHK